MINVALYLVPKMIFLSNKYICLTNTSIVAKLWASLRKRNALVLHEKIEERKGKDSVTQLLFGGATHSYPT